MFYTYDIPSYDPTDAINLWNLTGQRTRRPSQRPYGSRQDDGDAGDDDVSSDDNTDMFSNCPHDGRASRISGGRGG
jgi:hypothetical protein